MQKIIQLRSIYFCFFTCVSAIPPRFGYLRNTRFVPSRTHLDQVEKSRQFLPWASSGDVARRDKTEEAHMWTTHLSLFVAAFSSPPRLQVVCGYPKRPWYDTYTRNNGIACPVIFPIFYFVVFFCRLVVEKKTQVPHIENISGILIVKRLGHDGYQKSDSKATKLEAGRQYAMTKTHLPRRWIKATVTLDWSCV